MFYRSVVLPLGEQPAAPNNASAELRVGGDVPTPLTLSLTDLKKLPRTTLKVLNPHDKKEESSTFPIAPGSAKILKISQSGEVVGIIPGLTTVTGLTFDTAGRLYALELSAAAGIPNPGDDKCDSCRDWPPRV